VILTIFTWLMALQTVPTSQDEPFRAPQLASHASMTAMAYGAGQGIYIRVSHDLGATFGDAVKVTEAAVVPLNRHRGPRIAFSGGTLVVTAVVGHRASLEPHGHGLPSDGDLLAWRSADDGKTWSAGIVINDFPAAAKEGLHALAPDKMGNLFAVWLDKRSASGTSLSGARSMDGGATWSKNVLVYSSTEGTICQCCHPSLAVDPAGQIIVMWRNWLAGNRDMYIARSPDGTRFSQAEKIGTQSWPLNACPMDGGGLAVFHSQS
jgi:Neuraminidase (sialidase)